MNEAATNFAMVARRYCDWAEKPSSDTHEDLTMAKILLSDLLCSVLQLDPPDVTDDQETPDLVTPEQWQQVRDRFANLGINGYWSIFDPLTDPAEEPVYNLLSDDLGDIYRDVKEGLMLYEQGKLDDAVWEWRFGFDTHWGRHLTSALCAIHSYFS